MKIGSNQSVVQKLKIRKSNQGYSFQGANAQSFPTLSKMIDNSNDENSKRLQTPYLGHLGVPTPSVASSQMSCSDFERDQEDPDYVIDSPPPARNKLGRQPPLPPPMKSPIKPPVIQNLPKRDPPLSTFNKPPITLPARGGKPPKLVRDLQTGDLLVIGDHSPEIDDLPLPDDIPDDSSNNNTSLDILGDNAPTDVEVIYHRSDVKKLLKGKPNGTFLIYQGDKHTLAQPYTIYANKLSTTDGKVILIPFCFRAFSEMIYFEMIIRCKCATIYSGLLLNLCDYR